MVVDYDSRLLPESTATAVVGPDEELIIIDEEQTLTKGELIERAALSGSGNEPFRSGMIGLVCTTNKLKLFY